MEKEASWLRLSFFYFTFFLLLLLLMFQGIVLRPKRKERKTEANFVLKASHLLERWLALRKK